MKVLLIGQPNVGKTTLFNFLTKKNQYVSNIAGTTVGFAVGVADLNGKKAEIIDTPGIYSLFLSDTASITDKMVREAILGSCYDLIINVVTNDNLHNGLLFTTTLLTLGIPTVVVVNTTTELPTINTSKLELGLGCKVLALNLNKLYRDNTSRPMKYIKDFLTSKKTQSADNNIDLLLGELPTNTNYTPAPKIFYGAAVEKQLQTAETPAQRLDVLNHNRLPLKLQTLTATFVERILRVCSGPLSDKQTLTSKLDKLFLHKILGLPIFLLVMYLFFYVVIIVSKVFQDFMTSIAGIFFVNLPTALFQHFHIDNIFSVTVISLGNSLQVLAPFIPILLLFYFCLDFLENSGYMSRGAYLTDSIMRFFGLPGKSLVTMLIGFGCNVPAILATRTLNNKTERILTIVAAPFISCSARLTVYILFVAVFFPKFGVNIIYCLFLVGLVVGIFTVWFFKKALFPNKESYFILELPKYRMPSLLRLLKGAWIKVYQFMFKRVGKLIIPVMLIFYLLHYTFTNSPAIRNSFVVKGLYNAQVVLAPMGITKDNWPATISLVGGTIAKEIVLTTLQSLYLLDSKAQNNSAVTAYTKKEFIADLNDSFKNLQTGVKELGGKIGISNVKIDTHSDYYSATLAHVMMQKFKNIYSAIAYLLFMMIYTPCLITLGAVRKELNSKWMHFTNVWNIILAYVLGTCAYQLLTFSAHAIFSTCWIGGCITLFVILYAILKKLSSKLHIEEPQLPPLDILALSKK